MRGQTAVAWVAFLSLASTGCVTERQSTWNSPAEPASVASKKSDDSKTKRPPHAETCVSAGQFYEDHGEKAKTDEARQQALVQAERAYSQGVSLNPKYVPALYGVARVNDKMGNYAKAMEYYTRAAELAPKEVTLWHDQGMCWSRQKQFEKAVGCFKTAQALDPANKQTALALGHTYARMGRFDESFQTFKPVLGEAEAYLRIAMMAKHVGQPELARQYTQAALQLNPDLTAARTFLTQLDQPVTPEVQQVSHTVPAQP
jgi:tetratricopeptide (TPR) repeat protein